MNNQRNGSGAAPQAGASGAPDDEALDWALRMSSPDADWEAFVTWLEGDLARSERYDRAATALQDAQEAIAALPPRPQSATAHGLAAETQRAPRPTRRWVGGAIAAALVGAVGLGLWSGAPQPYAVQTAAGEQRTITLADGTSILLAGSTRVQLDREKLRLATLERGQALFRVRHDADHPFAVRVGDLSVVDLGTVFDVKRAEGRTRIAVAEGSVMVDPDGAAVKLEPGQAVVAEGSSLRRYPIESAEVGGWRDGRLAFDNSSLEEVAADLTRQLGRPVRASPAVARRTFNGTLDARTLRDRPRLLGQLLEVSVRTDDEGWTLEPAR